MTSSYASSQSQIRHPYDCGEWFSSLQLPTPLVAGAALEAPECGSIGNLAHILEPIA
jgi:hypothetical protein